MAVTLDLDVPTRFAMSAWVSCPGWMTLASDEVFLGCRPNYYKKAMAGTNLVLFDLELSKVFPDSASVNRTLRVLRDAAGKSTQTSRHAIKSSAHRKRSAA
jgi:hypothetical protein